MESTNVIEFYNLEILGGTVDILVSGVQHDDLIFLCIEKSLQ